MARLKKYKRTDTPSKKRKFKDDPLSTKSDRKGLLGFIEVFLRSFRNAMFIFLLSPLAVIYIICLSIALTPGVLIFQKFYDLSLGFSALEHAFMCALAFACGIICFWLTLIFIIPIFNLPLLPFVKPQKGTWYSLNVIPWYYHNALTQLARYTVLDFVTPTPLNLVFYRLMGMKIGKGVVINTSSISDPCLITLEDYVTIGGSATVFAHYGMKGYLIVDKVLIQKGSTLGLKASVMGNVIIGKNVMVTPHSVIMPKSRIPDNATVSP